MNSHKHARLTAIGRALLVSRVLDEGWSVAAASQAAGVSKRTGFKRLARFKAEGPQGLADRSSRPRRCPLALTPQEQRQLEELRQRWPLWRIAQQARRGMGTVSRYMKRVGLSRLKLLQPPSRSCATNVPRPASCCTWTPKARPHRRRGPPHHR